MKKNRPFLIVILFIQSFIYVNAQQITSISPNQSIQGQTLNVTVSGSNTHFQQGSNTFGIGYVQGSSTINKVTVNQIISYNDQQLIVNITVPNTTPQGIYDVWVKNSADGLLFKYSGFTITLNQAALTSINSDFGRQGQTLDVTVSGINNHFLQGSNTFGIGYVQGSNTTNNIIVNNLTVVNDNQLLINMTIPPYTPIALYDVWVNNSMYGLVSKSLFRVITLKAPYIDEVYPANGVTGETISVTIKGKNTHFQLGGGTSAYLTNSGKSNSSINFTNIQVLNDSVLNASLQIPSDAVTSFWDLIVNDGYETITKNLGFIINPVGCNITINAGSDVTTNGSSSVNLTATGADNYLWSTGGTTASITVTPTTTTSYSVTGTTGTCSATAEVVVMVGYTGIEVKDNKYEKSITLSPNPNKGEFNIIINTSENIYGSLKIVDLIGNTVFEQQKINFSSNHIMSVNLNNVETGIYYLILNNNSGNIVKKLIITK
ncbi:MAG: T9SS type A sorting domain-containing protein [Bacteroidota bacterium]|nr:T9SS type A sorting domain-containing protein [Bacteroidota bacterium]